MSASLADQAINLLVNRHWPMLPSKGPQKKPCVGWKRFQEHLPTVEEIRGWDRRFRPERWGLVTGQLAGIVVVDFDGEKGIDLMQEWGIEPHVRTGSGGFHWYLQHPGWRVPTLNAKSSRVTWPWPGLDIRGDGGFAVLLGRNSNGSYMQLRELIAEPFDFLPEEVHTFLRNHSAQENANQKPPDRIQGAIVDGGSRVDSEQLIRKALEIGPSTGRNNAGFWLACQLRDNGYSIGEGESAMRDYRSRVPSTNTKGQRESYTTAEVMATLREAFSKPAREPWAKREPRPERAAPTTAPSRNLRNDHLPKETPTQGDADNPANICIYVGHTGEPLVGHMGEPLFRNQYSRIPKEVSEDRRLKHRDIRVYGVLAGSCWQGNVVSVGKRRIAELAGCAPRLVIDSLRRLESTGHIMKYAGRLRGQRGLYILLSPIFGQKQRAGIDEVALGPGGRPRLVSVRKQQGTGWTSGLHVVPKFARLNGSERSKQR